MSSTRYSTDPESDPRPERHLASSRVSGLHVGTNIVSRIARDRSPEESAAMFWLANYANLLDVTADSLAGRLGLDKADIFAALTDPREKLGPFVAAVKALRAQFEGGLQTGANNPFFPGTTFHDAYGPLANTFALRKIANAIKFASGSANIVEVVGKTRTGKSVPAAHEYFKRLDSAAWLHCPIGGWRDFVFDLARCIGLSVGSTSLKTGQVISRISPCFGPGKIRLLFVDEGHRLWPGDISYRPDRLEFLRDLWEIHGVSVVILATPQYSSDLAGSMASERFGWAAGQLDGRVQRAHLPDAVSDSDLAAIAMHHFPEGDPAAISALVEQAKASDGYAGAMVNAIRRARFMASMDGKPVSISHIQSAQAEAARGTRLAAIAGTKKPRRRK